MPLSLQDWDHQVGHHLRSICNESRLIVLHAEAMTRRPDWETRAEDELAKADAALALALGHVRHAAQLITKKARDV